MTSSYVQIGEQDNAFDLVFLIERLCGIPSSLPVPEDEASSPSSSSPSSSPTLFQLAESADFLALFQQGVIQHLPQILNPSSSSSSSSSLEQEIESCLLLSLSLLARIPNLKPVVLRHCVTSLLANLALSSSSPSASSSPLSPSTRLRTITALFNLLSGLYASSSSSSSPSSPSSSPLVSVELLALTLIDLLKTGLVLGLGRELMPSLISLKITIKEFENTLTPPPSSSSSSSSSYGLICELHRLLFDLASQANHAQSDELLSLYLRSVDHSRDNKLLQSCSPYAKQAVLLAITAPLAAGSSLNAVIAASPSTSTFAPSSSSSSSSDSSPLTTHRLLALRSIQALQLRADDKEAQLLYELLASLATSQVAKVDAFVAREGQFLARMKLDAEELKARVKTLKLCDLAAGTTDQVLSYEMIVEALNLSTSSSSSLALDEEVERVVIEAILSERMEAKIDQVRRRVQVSRVHSNIVKMQGDQVTIDWSSIEAKLAAWKNNVGAVIRKLDAARVSGEQAGEPLAVEEI